MTFTGQRVCWVNDAQGNKKSEECASQLLKTPSKTKRTFAAVGAYLGIKKDGELTQDTCGSKLFFKKTDMQNSASFLLPLFLTLPAHASASWLQMTSRPGTQLWLAFLDSVSGLNLR